MYPQQMVAAVRRMVILAISMQVRGGNGGANGDYAIFGISFVTFESTGTIYGATS